MSSIGTNSLADTIKFFNGCTDRCTFAVTTINKLLPVLSAEVLAKLVGDDVRQLLILNTKFTLLSTVNQSLDCKGSKIVRGLKEVVVQKGGSPEKLDKHLTQYSELLEGFVKNYEETVIVFKSLNKKADANEVLDKIRTHLSDSKVKERIASVQKNVKALLDGEPAEKKEEPKNAALKHAMDLLKKGGLEKSKTVSVLLGGKERVVGDVVGYRLRERVIGIESELNKRDKKGEFVEPNEAVIAKILGVPKNEVAEYLKMRLNMSVDEHVSHLTNILEIDAAEIEIERFQKLAKQAQSLHEDYKNKREEFKLLEAKTLVNVVNSLNYIAATLCSEEKPRNMIDKIKISPPKASKFLTRILYCDNNIMPTIPGYTVVSRTSYTGNLQEDLRSLMQIEVDLAKHMQKLEIYYGINAQDFQELSDMLEDYLADFDSELAEKKKIAATLNYLDEAEDPKVVTDIKEKIQKACSVPIDFNKPAIYNIYRLF